MRQRIKHVHFRHISRTVPFIEFWLGDLEFLGGVGQGICVIALNDVNKDPLAKVGRDRERAFGQCWQRDLVVHVVVEIDMEMKNAAVVVVVQELAIIRLNTYSI
ncbi:hypothetical protein H257_03823 [Aphanomyces astaci]|uniref:Uncharacterized protein n=1 Tax=Aphanomyces astaci TaxID=112090 RepID=W4H0A9_APHAT|nr:hypothetical protein H257_03823 [Aphanomyces astaci]ETV84699.1 hypothetical protein H257_03823 [Aphanomyces astaci]|eukprot:XP_009826391.1 hypothetical protein H257_03823 [Aphanomyces astaci]